MLRNIKSHLDKVLEMNQANEVSIEDDTPAYDKIECHLIGCVSVICRAIKSSDDTKIKNVTISVCRALANCSIFAFPQILVWLSMVAENYSFSNLNNSKEFLTVMLEMHAAHQEDPILLATTIKHLCNSFGRINNVSIYTL